MALDIQQHDDAVSFEVRVAPRASREAILGTHGGALKVALTAPPVGGAANDALVKLLASELRVPRAQVSIVRGETSKTKLVRVEGVDASRIRALA